MENFPLIERELLEKYYDQRVCLICGKIFIAHTRMQKTCSNRCSKKLQMINNRKSMKLKRKKNAWKKYFFIK